MDGGQNSREMPKYKCYKEVWALKIKAIEVRRPTIDEIQAILDDNSLAPVTAAIITPEEEGYAPFPVDSEFIRKHNPHVGGYFVVYKDGYKSFSPSDAFEEGYTRIP